MSKNNTDNVRRRYELAMIIGLAAEGIQHGRRFRRMKEKGAIPSDRYPPKFIDVCVHASIAFELFCAFDAEPHEALWMVCADMDMIRAVGEYEAAETRGTH